MKIVIAPDKFKGCLDSFSLCNAIEAGVLLVEKNAEIIKLPLADGGDGFATVLAYYLDTVTITHPTIDPIGRPINASFQWSEKEKTAIIEMATASGLALLTLSERNPLIASTYGTGLLIKKALNLGASKIILGIGGSATNDAGTGILAALGFKFYNEQGIQLEPYGRNLGQIINIIFPEQMPDCEFLLACDVENVLLGDNGAAKVYAPQKGADEDTVMILEENMKSYAMLVEKILGKELNNTPGFGAAGGTPLSMMLLKSITLRKGTDIVMEESMLSNKLKNADLVITGEGMFDDQTLYGKVIYALTQEAQKQEVPVVAICGAVNADYSIIKKSGLAFVTGISNKPISLTECLENSKELVIQKTASVVSFFKLINSGKK